MPRSPFAAQLYTLRDYTKTPADIAKTFARVRKIGYEAVQLSALGKIDPQELAGILKNEGLTVAATHVSQDRMKAEPQAVIDEHHLWGCKYTAIGGFFPKDPTTQDWYNFADEFNRVIARFAGSGVSVGYHNHSHELASFDGKPALQILIEKLAPAAWFEIDTYWIAHGGGNPAAWIGKVSGRIPCVHLKDMGIKYFGPQYMMEVGQGNLDWRGILAACKAAKTEWLIVEQDECYRDPFDSLELSLKNLQQMAY